MIKRINRQKIAKRPNYVGKLLQDKIVCYIDMLHLMILVICPAILDLKFAKIWN